MFVASVNELISVDINTQTHTHILMIRKANLIKTPNEYVALE